MTLIHKYEPLKMKEDGMIAEIFSRFQTLIAELKLLNKDSTTPNHIKKDHQNLSKK